MCEYAASISANSHHPPTPQSPEARDSSNLCHSNAVNRCADGARRRDSRNLVFTFHHIPLYQTPPSLNISHAKFQCVLHTTITRSSYQTKRGFFCRKWARFALPPSFFHTMGNSLMRVSLVTAQETGQMKLYPHSVASSITK